MLLIFSGLIWSEIKQLWEVGLREYVSDMWNVVDFVTNSLYVATIALRLVAYYKVIFFSYLNIFLILLSELDTNSEFLYCDMWKRVKWLWLWMNKKCRFYWCIRIVNFLSWSWSRKVNVQNWWHWYTVWDLLDYLAGLFQQQQAKQVVHCRRWAIKTWHLPRWSSLRNFCTSRHWQKDNLHFYARHFQVQEEIRRGSPTAYLPREHWDTWDPMLISEGLFAAANIFSNLKLVYIFSVNPYLPTSPLSLSP